MRNLKKGFTLIELLAVISILAVIITIAYPIIGNIIENSRVKAFELSEESFVKAVKNYIILEDIALPNTVGESIEISYADLLSSGKIKEIKDPKDKSECSNSKVIVTNTNQGTYSYNPVVICANYTSVVNKASCSVLDKVWYDEACNAPRASGTMVQDDSGKFVIESVDDLILINTDVTSLDGSYILGISLDLFSETNFVPLGNITTPFTGEFYGQDYTLSNLTISRPTEVNIGLFGVISGAIIEDLNVDTISISALSYSGAFVAKAINNSSIDNCSTTNGTVTTESTYAGGFIGENNNSTVRNSYSSVDVHGKSYAVGGFAATNAYDGIITDCYATGDVLGDIHIIGGFVGANKEGAITKNSYATGHVTGQYRSGGFAGHITSSSIVRNCYATGDVENVGDKNTENCWEFGGFVGYIENTTVSYSYSTGDIIGNWSEAIGGFVGSSSNATVQFSYTSSSSTNSENNYVSSFAGNAYSTWSYVKYSYAIGDIAGDYRVGEIRADGDWSVATAFKYVNQTKPTIYYLHTPVGSLADLNNVSWFTDTVGFDSNWQIDEANTMLDTKGNSIIKPLLYRIDDSNVPTTTLVIGQ